MKLIIAFIGLSFLVSFNSYAGSVTYITIPVRTQDYMAAYIKCQDDPNRPAHFRGGGNPRGFEGAAVTVSSGSRPNINLPRNINPNVPVYSLTCPTYVTRNVYVEQKIQNNVYKTQQNNYQINYESKR
jgi:hypothetical protein